MYKSTNKLKKHPLFNGIVPAYLERILNCLDFKTKSYKKNETFIDIGDKAQHTFGLLEGKVRCHKEDMEGFVCILGELSAPALFVDALPPAILNCCPIRIYAIEDCEAFLLSIEKLLNPCSLNCAGHTRLIINLLYSASDKTVLLSNKVEILSQATTRQKIFCFLNQHKGKEKRFAIPYNRNELAQYLCVDRTMLSKELSKMRKEGLIWFHLNEFEILQ